MNSSFGYRGYTLEQNPGGPWMVVRILTKQDVGAFPTMELAMQACDDDIDRWVEDAMDEVPDDEEGDDIPEPDEPASL